MEVFDRGEHFAVIGTLHDQRPWADGSHGPRDLHRMELGIVVRRADLCIVDAVADMQQFPHVECTGIEDSFADLVGLSVARGYSHAVQERFGRERGCSHLEFLARALGAPASKVLFVGTDARALGVEESAFAPLESVLLVTHRAAEAARCDATVALEAGRVVPAAD